MIVMTKTCQVCGQTFEASGKGSARKTACGEVCRRKRAAEQQRDYYRNRGGREVTRAWYTANVERIARQHKEWVSDPDVKAARAAYNRDYHRANADNIRERKRETRDPERERRYSSARRARIAEVSVTVVTDRDIERILARPCTHAHLGDCDGPMNLDHIIPLARGGRHAVGNLQPLCRRHNVSKRHRLEVEVKARARRKVAA